MVLGKGLMPCEIVGTRAPCSLGVHTLSLPRRRGGCLAVLLKYVRSVLTLTHTHTLFSKKLKCLETCEKGVQGVVW